MGMGKNRNRALAYARRGAMWVGSAAIGAVVASPSAGRAETFVKVESCQQAREAVAGYVWCVLGRRPFCQAPPTAQCWDFEEGTLGDSYFGDWFAPYAPQTNLKAFLSQPTFGDNVRTSRVLQRGAQRNQLDGIGGDYWNVPYPIGHQGRYWIGTYESRPSESQPWGAVQGDDEAGWARSPAFVVSRRYVDFLVGGGCDVEKVHVRLEVQDPSTQEWAQAVNAATGASYRTTGRCSELMVREAWDTGPASGLQGRTVRVVVSDMSTTGWGHINVDHVRHTDEQAPDFGGENQPVWGFADTHAHPANHTSSRGWARTPSFDQNNDGHVFHGGTGSFASEPAAFHLLSCDGNGHGTDNHAPPMMLATLEKASFGRAPAATDVFGRPYGEVVPRWPGERDIFGAMFAGAHPGGGALLPGLPGTDLVGWPYWWTRAHQQMHVSWIRRAYEGGQRLMVASAGNAEILGAFMRSHHAYPFMSDYSAMVRFADHMRALAALNGDWMEIALSPAQARQIVRANKLAVVLATEVDDLGDKCDGDFTQLSPAQDGNYTEFTGTRFEFGPEFWERFVRKNRGTANSCTTLDEWTRRVEALYGAGFRLITPVHLTNNALGGAAINGDLFHPMQHFLNGSWFSVSLSPDTRGKLSPASSVMGWCKNCYGFPAFTTSQIDGQPTGVPWSVDGHVNNRALTGLGAYAIREMMKRGMLVDLAHMGQWGRYRVLGVDSPRTTSTASLVNPGCDMDTPECRESAYPVLSSHGGFRPIDLDREEGAYDHRGWESSLDDRMIDRIRDVGGTVAVGTAPGDVLDTDAADPAGTPYTGVLRQNVANDCAGSTRTLAQSYVFALRRMSVKGGVTLGTDINGFEAQLNPRFGTTACYARGNVPWVYPLAWDGTPLMGGGTASPVPVNYGPRLIRDEVAGGAIGTAFGQARRQAFSTPALRYSHYGDSAPSGPRVRRIIQHPEYVGLVSGRRFDLITADRAGTLTSAGVMTRLSDLPPLSAHRTGDRTFDFNYDGLAHYGMLPDMLQDLRAVGMTQEQLGPLFQSADAFIRMWTKACRIATDPARNAEPGLAAPGCS